MNIALLVFLIINALFLSIVVLGFIVDCKDKKTKNIKKIGELEFQVERTKLDCIDLEKKCTVLSIRKQQSSKYKLSQKVLASITITGQRTLKPGMIKQIRVSKDKVEYEIDFEASTYPQSQVFEEKDIFPDITQ